MDNNYCPECGNKLQNESVFCDKCGFKIVEKENKTKFCFNCGETIDYHAEICPKCGVRLINPIKNSASDLLSSSQRKIDDGISKFSRYVTVRNVAIVLLVIMVLILISLAPTIIDVTTPYKQIDASYIPNHVAGEKVQFDGEYMGHTSWGANSFLFYSSIKDNDIVKVGDQYVILQGDYLGHDLYGHEGSTVHLEGRFAQGGPSHEKFGDGYIDGYWFGPETIELI